MVASGLSYSARSLDAILQNVFHQIDTNGDGMVDATELFNALTDTGLSSAEMEKLFLALDTDADGRLSQEEFMAGMDSFQRTFHPGLELLRTYLHPDLLSRYETRGSDVPEAHDRGLTPCQLAEIGSLAAALLKQNEFRDDWSGLQISWSTRFNRTYLMGEVVSLRDPCTQDTSWKGTVIEDFGEYLMVESEDGTTYTEPKENVAEDCGKCMRCNMYHVCDLFVMPLTARHRCSWVELVAQGPQQPRWFVSHAWSTAFSMTLEMIEWHQTVHKLSSDTPYWICTFANNQWNLVELKASLEETPFWRAIEVSVGVVQVMDKACTPHTRIWCIMEVYVATCLHQKPFEILAYVERGAQIWGAARPAGPVLRDQAGREIPKGEGSSFPGDVACKGARVCIQQATASQRQDMVNIKEHITHLDTHHSLSNETWVMNHMYQAGDIVSLRDSDLCSSQTGVHCTVVTDDGLQIQVERDGNIHIEPKSKLYKAIMVGEHPAYDLVNQKVRRLFRGACIWSHAQGNEFNELLELLTEYSEEDNSEAINYLANGWTPLFIAVDNRSVECVKILLEHSADPNQPNTEQWGGWLPIESASRPREVNNHIHPPNPHLVQLLVEHGADINPVLTISDELCAEADYAEDVDMILRILNKADEGDRQAYSHIARTYAQGEIVYLMDNSIWIGEPDGWKCTIVEDLGEKITVECEDGATYSEPKHKVLPGLYRT